MVSDDPIRYLQKAAIQNWAAKDRKKERKENESIQQTNKKRNKKGRKVRKREGSP